MNFKTLESEDIEYTVDVCSTVSLMRRHLLEEREVATIIRRFDRSKTSLLIEYIRQLLAMEYDKKFKHPNEPAICAAVVILSTQPIEHVCGILTELSKTTNKSISWVCRLSQHCLGRMNKKLNKIEVDCMGRLNCSICGCLTLYQPHIEIVACPPDRQPDGLLARMPICIDCGTKVQDAMLDRSLDEQ